VAKFLCYNGNMTTRKEMKGILNEVDAERAEKELRLKELNMGIVALEIRAKMLRASKKLLDAAVTEEEIKEMRIKVKELELELTQGFSEEKPNNPKYKN